jgi:thiosulfate/3-mercaptopyruvate sulfurtransferase
MDLNTGYAQPQALVSTDWVAQHSGDANVRLVEVDVDTSAYASGHIAGAIGWDWQRDLQRQPERDIPTKGEWEALLSRSGIGSTTLVVFYGDNHNWFAAFAYWLCKLYSHNSVALMNGGRQAWLDEDRPTTTAVPAWPATAYAVTHMNQRLRADRDDVARAMAADATVLVDVRSPAEFSGELLAPANLPQEGAQRGGHIPGAANVPWGSVVAEDGAFKPVEALRALYGGKGVSEGAPTITYCRIGERSAHTWFVLTELLGLPNVRNYDGSWTEWGSLIGAPIER